MKLRTQEQAEKLGLDVQKSLGDHWKPRVYEEPPSRTDPRREYAVVWEEQSEPYRTLHFAGFLNGIFWCRHVVDGVCEVVSGNAKTPFDALADVSRQLRQMNVRITKALEA